MPELSLIENFISAQEPWPENVKLYQPYEVEQILLPDNASCLSVKAFLNMCKLPFDVEMRWNAEFMSPTGRVPFIHCGPFVIAELEPIVNFCHGKGISLCSRLSADEKSDLKAFMSLISNVLVNAELYVSWLDEETYRTVTKVRNGSVYPWPLGWLQTSTKRSQVARLLGVLHWRDKTMDQVIHDVELCCSALSQRLGDKDFFFGVPTELDALIYGHVRALLQEIGPRTPELLKTLTMTLLNHTVRVASLIKADFTHHENALIQQAKSVCPMIEPFVFISDETIVGKTSLKDLETFKRTDLFDFRPFSNERIELTYTSDGNVKCTANVDKGVHPITFNKVENESQVIDSESTRSVEHAFTDIIDLPKERITSAKPISARYKEELECAHLLTPKSRSENCVTKSILRTPNTGSGMPNSTESSILIKPQKETIVFFSNNKDSSNNVNDKTSDKKSDSNISRGLSGEYLESVSKFKSVSSQNSTKVALTDEVTDTETQLFSSSTAMETSESDIHSIKDILKQNIAWLDSKKHTNTKVNSYLTSALNQKENICPKSNKSNQKVDFVNDDVDVMKGKVFNSSGIFENSFVDTDQSEISMVQGSDSSMARFEHDDCRTYTITDRSSKSTDEGELKFTITDNQNNDVRLSTKDAVTFESKIHDCGDEKSISNDYDFEVDLFQNIYDVVGRRQKSGESLNLNGINGLDCPTELDALVFGHVFTIITTRLPCSRLADAVRKHPALVALAKRVDERYFKRP